MSKKTDIELDTSEEFEEDMADDITEEEVEEELAEADSDEEVSYEESEEEKQSKKRRRKEAEELSDTPATESEINKKLSVEAKKKLSFGVVLAIILVVAFGGMFIAKSKSSKASYTKVLNTIADTRQGSFRYVIDVRTGEGEVEVPELEVTSEESSETEATTEEVATTEGKHENSEWDNESGTQVDRWIYPNYQIIIEGCTKSVEPLATNYSISITTDYESDVFTNVTVFENKAYIDVEQIGKWLMNSHDSYLQSLNQYITDGAKYYVIDMNSFNIHSRYAEDGEDGAYTEGYETLHTCVKALISLISSCDIKEGDNGSVTITGLDTNLVNFIDSIDNLYDQTGFKKEYKDNVVDAFSGEKLILDTTDNMNMSAAGVYRKYETSKGNSAYEANFQTSYELNGVSKNISVQLYKSGDVVDIVMPTGSTTSTPMELEKCINSMLDYFNFTDIKLENKLNTTPASVRDDLIENIIKYIGDSTVNRDNYMTYLEEHMTDENIKAMFDAINEVTGDLVVTVEKEVEEEVERYPEFNYTGDGLSISGQYNEAESSDELIVIDLLILNESDEDTTVDLTGYSLKTHKGNTYPANNTTILRDFDNSFDFTKVVESQDIVGTGYARVKLYFVPSDVPEYLDLWNGDTQIGVVALY